jgi:hypothetical protein
MFVWSGLPLEDDWNEKSNSLRSFGEWSWMRLTRMFVWSGLQLEDYRNEEMKILGKAG